MRRIKLRGRNRSRGQALLEFALVLPIFLLIVFGIIDIGRYVYLTNAFNEGAREGARYGSVEQWQYDCPASVPVASQTRFACTAAVALGRVAGAPAYVSTPTVTCYSKGDDATSAVSSAACRAGYMLQVTVSTPTSPANQQFHFLTPVIGQLLGSPTISGQASVVVQ
jgi:Flp pilus assembly protein TadG